MNAKIATSTILAGCEHTFLGNQHSYPIVVMYVPHYIQEANKVGDSAAMSTNRHIQRSSHNRNSCENLRRPDRLH